MTLDDWCHLRPGDVLHWEGHDRKGPFYRLVSPIHREPRDKHQTWPEGWRWELLDPAHPPKYFDGTLGIHMKEFYVRRAA